MWVDCRFEVEPPAFAVVGFIEVGDSVDES